MVVDPVLLSNGREGWRVDHGHTLRGVTSRLGNTCLTGLHLCGLHLGIWVLLLRYRSGRGECDRSNRYRRDGCCGRCGRCRRRCRGRCLLEHLVRVKLGFRLRRRRCGSGFGRRDGLVTVNLSRLVRSRGRSGNCRSLSGGSCSSNTSKALDLLAFSKMCTCGKLGSRGRADRGFRVSDSAKVQSRVLCGRSGSGRRRRDVNGLGRSGGGRSSLSRLSSLALSSTGRGTSRGGIGSSEFLLVRVRRLQRRGVCRCRLRELRRTECPFGTGQSSSCGFSTGGGGGLSRFAHFLVVTRTDFSMSIQRNGLTTIGESEEVVGVRFEMNTVKWSQRLCCCG